MQVTSSDTLEKRESYLRTGSKPTAILVYGRVWEGWVIKVSPYAECYSLSSLFLTMVAELKETMNEKENRNKEDSVSKVIYHAQRSAKKKLLGKIPGSTCKKNPHVIVLATEIKSNSSFFNKDANTTKLNNMNARQLHFDSSDCEEDLNRKKKKSP